MNSTASTTAFVTLAAHALVIDLHTPDPGDRISRELPIGIDLLLRQHLTSDPPRPEELTNAIGSVADHIDDLVIERPDLLGAAVHLRGPLAEAVAAVEHGGEPLLPFVLERGAAEDVFRTLATEAANERRLNPGLPADLVESVVAGCCTVVGVMRRLQLADVTVIR
jgi:exopolyphosphatase/guanosine-5'-triphosphate,3'-diphosphate pyrophosphatase